VTARVLIVDDEPKIAALLRDYLVNGGFETIVLEIGLGVVDWVRANKPDAILLDVMLPGESGLSICKAIREFSDVPILLITARVEEIDRLLGLELGADDYICKPFSPREVVARVKAVLRRATTSATAIASSIELDEARFEVRVRGHALILTPVEFRLLGKLLAQPGRVFSRQQLMDAAYRDHRVVSDRTVDSHVKNLRRKLTDAGFDPIASVYGIGYRLEPSGD
jgi:two-component system, OmpR family, response regulator BaeR